MFLNFTQPQPAILIALPLWTGQAYARRFAAYCQINWNINLITGSFYDLATDNKYAFSQVCFMIMEPNFVY